MCNKNAITKYTGIFAISYNGVLGRNLYEKGGIDSDRLYDSGVNWLIHLKIIEDETNKIFILFVQLNFMYLEQCVF